MGDSYTTSAYRRSIARACRRAGIGPWHPHQLRHTSATEIRRRCGLVAAQLVLGHASAKITDAVYAARDDEEIERVVRKIG